MITQVQVSELLDSFDPTEEPYIHFFSAHEVELDGIFKLDHLKRMVALMESAGDDDLQHAV